MSSADNYIVAIVVSYNNPHDTIECLESLARSSDKALSHVFLVDNSSTDEPVSRIKSWAEGARACSVVAPQGCGKPVAPISYDELARMAAQPAFSVIDYVATALEATSRRQFAIVVINEDESLPDRPENGNMTLVIIRSRQNRGYAGGINTALAYGLRLDVAAFWVLNNDTIVHPDACLELKNRLFSCQRPGLVGGLVLYNSHPPRVQCQAGGYTSAAFFLSRLFGHMQSLEEVLTLPPERIEKKLNFIYGASFMISRDFIERIGSLDERLFLYCEEQDLAWSARGKFDLAYAPRAIILHKEGRSTKLSRYNRPLFRLMLIARNKVLVTLKHHPWALPTVLMGIGFSAVRNYLRIFLRT